MEESKFFRNIWRFNAIVISTAGIISIFLLIFAGYHIIKDLFGKRQVEDVVNITENENISEKWSLGYMKSLEGTDYVLVPLESDQSYAQSYYSKSSSSYRNFLFINLKTNEQHWLFTQNKWLIAKNDYLYDKKYGQKDRKVIAIMYNIVKSDTDKDKRLTVKDKLTLALSNPSGGQYREILPSIDKLIGHSLIGTDEILILYQNRNIAYAARFSLENFKLVNEKELTKIKNNS